MSTVSPTDTDVAETAYFLWLQEGCPAGREEAHWFAAQAQLMPVKKPARKAAPKKAPAPKAEKPAAAKAAKPKAEKAAKAEAKPKARPRKKPAAE